MSLAERTEVVDDFNNSAEQFVFLISTKAGGVGLNIVSANKVVIFDPNWNPAHDLQAQDRAYRIGQTRDVEVYRLISVGTVEENVYARQIYKQQQANIGYNATSERRYFSGVDGDIRQRGELFGIENLLSFHGGNHMLKAIFNNTNVKEQEFDIAMTEIKISQEDIDDADIEGGLDAHGISGVIELVEVEQKSTSVPQRVGQPDTIAAILAGAGVQYTHQNTEVIGSSKTEARISELAAKAVQSDRTLAARPAFNINRVEFQVGHVPIEIRKRQFVSMARFYGYPTPLDFAIAVENMSLTKRVETLNAFYKSCKDPETLAGLEIEGDTEFLETGTKQLIEQMEDGSLVDDSVVGDEEL